MEWPDQQQIMLRPCARICLALSLARFGRTDWIQDGRGRIMSRSNYVYWH